MNVVRVSAWPPTNEKFTNIRIKKINNSWKKGKKTAFYTLKKN